METTELQQWTAVFSTQPVPKGLQAGQRLDLSQVKWTEYVHSVNRFTSVEYTYNAFFKSLLCYVLYSVHLKFMRQGIEDWPSRMWRRVKITSTVALRIVKGDGKGTQCRGYNWATLGSKLGESRIWDSPAGLGPETECTGEDQQQL
jgi:hypothetical protein